MRKNTRPKPRLKRNPPVLRPVIGQALRKIVKSEHINPAECFVPGFLRLNPVQQDQILNSLERNLGEIFPEVLLMKNDLNSGILFKGGKRKLTTIRSQLKRFIGIYERESAILLSISTENYIKKLRSPGFYKEWVTPTFGTYWHNLTHDLDKIQKAVNRFKPN